jgi:TetR/AcrR family transcriptional regulator
VKTKLAAKKSPAVRDPEKSRETIITHAMDEFVAKGYDGARVDVIAEKCDVSKNLLYHYYGSKSGLFVAVLERMYDTLRLRNKDFTVDVSDPERGLEQLVARTFAVFWEHPEFISLMNTANLHKAEHITNSARIRNRYSGLIATITELLRNGAERGIFRRDIDPVLLYIALASLSYHYLSNQYTFKVTLGVDLSSKKMREMWLKQSTLMVLAYCRVPNGARASSERELAVPA